MEKLIIAHILSILQFVVQEHCSSIPATTWENYVAACCNELRDTLNRAVSSYTTFDVVYACTNQYGHEGDFVAEQLNYWYEQGNLTHTEGKLDPPIPYIFLE